MSRAESKTMVKNTTFLYFRMFLIMIITLYTSRVTLKILGITDFGIYSVVGGIVGLLFFLNNALSTSSSRFLAFDLGKNDLPHLIRTFSTLFSLHLILSVLIILLSETIGLWFLYNHLKIPAERFAVAVFIFHISVITCVLSIMQTPYTAAIIAHEKMNMYAFIGIFESVSKLGVVFLLKTSEFDKLKLYAILIAAIQLIILVLYHRYCSRYFIETRYKPVIDKKIISMVADFSGWSLLSGGSIALNLQGINILTNMFFGPPVVSARSISLQINTMLVTFANNFRTAINPQIIKRYARDDRSGSETLVLITTRYTYFLILLITVPLVCKTGWVLNVWLDEVPEYTILFSQIIIIQNLFSVFDTGLYMSLYAKGQLKENALISPLLGFLSFPVIYWLFKKGYGPVSLSWVFLIVHVVLGLVIKPILAVRIANYRPKEIFRMFLLCFIISIIVFPVPLFLAWRLEDNWISFLLISFLSTAIISVSVFYLGIESDHRVKILSALKNKLSISNS